MITNLPDKLREVTGLTTFAELFGFDWDSGDWTWSDVAEKMALEVEEYYRRGYEDKLHASELLPCPFCGSEAAVEEYNYYDDGPDYSVQCTNVLCACSGPYCFWRTKEEAVKAWNTRYDRTCHDTGVRYPGWTCSECGSEQMHAPNFCPDCGAKVVEE